MVMDKQDTEAFSTLNLTPRIIYEGRAMAHLLRSGLNVQFSGLDMLTPLLRLALLRHLRNVFWELAENMHTIMCVDMLHLTPA